MVSRYVDQPNYPFGRMMMCHLWANSFDELLAMVDRIPTLSFGKHRDASWVYFDIAKGMRARALATGAIETGRYGARYCDARRRGRTEMVAAIEEIRDEAGKPVDGIIRATEPRMLEGSC